MNVIFRILLQEIYWNPHQLKTLSLCSKTIHTEVSIKSVYIEWCKRIRSSLFIIQKSGKLVCGERCVIYCLLTKIDPYIFSMKLENLISYSGHWYRCTENSECISESNLIRETQNPNSQHSLGVVFVSHTKRKPLETSLIKRGGTRWCSDNDDSGRSLVFNNNRDCPCHHCQTVGRKPDSFCYCPKCTDPVTGINYIRRFKA